METTSHSIGKDAEKACCRYLQNRGLKLITHNYRCRLGEIDLVMEDGNTIVFVEVRFRKNDAYGGALESITERKKQCIMLAAEHYMQFKSRSKMGRIDVVAMSQKRQNTPRGQDDLQYNFSWIKNAF